MTSFCVYYLNTPKISPFSPDKLERETKPRLKTWTLNPDCGLGTWDHEPEPHVYSLDLEPEAWTWDTITCALNLNPV